jgi:hypothetical protein
MYPENTFPDGMRDVLQEYLLGVVWSSTCWLLGQYLPTRCLPTMQIPSPAGGGTPCTIDSRTVRRCVLLGVADGVLDCGALRRKSLSIFFFYMSPTIA